MTTTQFQPEYSGYYALIIALLLGFVEKLRQCLTFSDSTEVEESSCGSPNAEGFNVVLSFMRNSCCVVYTGALS